MSERLVRANGVDLCIETFGDPATPAILLIHGAAASMLWWEGELCERLAANGRYVIRFDNRDTGRSVSYPPGRPDYSMPDMAMDAIGILDLLGIERAHVIGTSMFGGIALILGVDHADRVASLTFLSSSTGADDLPQSTVTFTAEDPDPADRAAVVDYIVAFTRAYAGRSPYFDEGATRALVERDVARTHNMASALTNHYAIDFDGPASGGFADIAVPTLVVHGELDPVFPLPHAEALRDAVRGAELVVLPKTGHELPRPVWDVFVDALVRHTARA
jgi:pimeloyl-ACP methyl ester carboxylesterase